MVYGENLRGRIDLMYSGWVENALSQIGVCEWVGKIAECLNLIRDEFQFVLFIIHVLQCTCAQSP